MRPFALPEVHLAELRPGPREPEHGHATAHACLVVDGAIEDDAKRRDARLDAGDVRFDVAGARHDVRAAAPAASCVIAEWGPGSDGRRSADVRRVPGLAARARAAAADWRGAACPAAADLSRFRLAAAFERARRDGDAAAPPAWLAEAAAALDASFAEIRIDALARAAGVHRATLHDGFVCAFGVGPQGYRTLRRLERAAAELRAGRSGAVAAAAAGFADQAQLSRTWRARFGAPPRAWLCGRTTIVQDGASGT